MSPRFSRRRANSFLVVAIDLPYRVRQPIRRARVGAPEVSVLLPVFNGADTLRRALASVRRQRGIDWECVVVDDGSNDASAWLAQEASREDPRFRCVFGPHRGIVAALRMGVSSCRAPLIARMDADDIMVSGRLLKQADALREEPRLAAVGTHVELFPRGGLREGRLAYESWLNSLRSARDVEADAFVECPIAHPTLMVRTDVLRELSYREAGWPEDYDLILRLLGAGYRVGVVPEVLLRWRDSPHRLSRTSATYSTRRFVACKAAFLADGFLASSERYVLWGYGGTGRLLRRELARYAKTPAYIVELHPGRLGQIIAGARVIPPERLPTVERLPIVVSVAGAVARNQIREALARMGFVEVDDYRIAA
jgi:glycosyltransferase involved in cell wall biosynthesis